MKRTIVIAIFLSALAAVLSWRIYVLMTGDTGAFAAANAGGTVTLFGDSDYGTIFDRDMERLTGTKTRYQAVIKPGSIDAAIAAPYIIDRETFEQQLSQNRPFLAEVKKDAPRQGRLIIFESHEHTSDWEIAPHIVGYTSDGAGVTGIEAVFDRLLRTDREKSSITFSVDARGGVLQGEEATVHFADPPEGGVVLTLDSKIQQIAVEAAEHNGLEKGAIVVMSLEGDILASASFPQFNAADVESYLNAPDSPLINRVTSPFAVGSIFKLTTAAEALEEGITPEYTYHCRGSITVAGNVFNCHSWAGHGVIDIREAIVYSCNPFFVALNSDISLSRYRERLTLFGFGQGLNLTDTNAPGNRGGLTDINAAEQIPGIYTAAGNLPTITELTVPAERANISFGQGKLTATPLQVCRFTAAIAAGGLLPTPRLVKTLIYPDGEKIEQITASPQRVMTIETADFLRTAMIDTIKTSVQTALPKTVTAGGKTSTAQTGIIKDDGTEMVQVWFTGFFPADNPQYSVTVLVEDGISGTLTAAPIFAEIAEKIGK
jgi:penicillin-binding protein 2